MENHGTLYIISAPSGAGKSTLVEAILNKGPHRSLTRAITYTTRHPRNNERNGYDFHFTTDDIFTQYIKQGFFLEWSNAHAAYYGTPRSILDDLTLGKSYILVIDRVGAEQIRAQTEHAILIWITVPDMATLERRLVNRATEAPAHIERRLNRAQKEIALEHENPIYDYHIMNDDFQLALKDLEDIIDAQYAGKDAVGGHSDMIIE